MSRVLEILKNALISDDPDIIEDAVDLVWKRGISTQYTEILIHMLSLSSHRRHEDIVLLLQQLKDPKAIPILFEIASRIFEPLEDDEALIRKCTWALADIGTTEAKNKLEILSTNEDYYIASCALKRLIEWESEISRKGIS